LFCLVYAVRRHLAVVRMMRTEAGGQPADDLGGWWQPPSAGPYYDAMSARPAEHHADPLDPQRILRELPDRERANFLAAYREALDGARDPAGWGHLRRVLRLWSGMVIATNRPGFYEAQEAALTGTGSDAYGESADGRAG